MPKRRLSEPFTVPGPLPPEIESGGGLYFSELPEATEFIPTGSTLLDLSLGGGWALGRISNVYGDSATGKTALGIEACTNFVRTFPDGKAMYRERESAFDPDYAEHLGMPLDQVDFVGYEDGLDSVEDLFDDLGSAVEGIQKSNHPGFYCVDSLDAFPDEKELESDIRDNSQVAKKGRIMSELFRRQVGAVNKSRMHLMFISQIRAKIGVTMGRKTEMVGGTAIRFYASQRIFLKQVERLSHDVKGVKRTVGVKVSAMCEKNKKGMPFREVEFPILFGYGIDDLTSCVDFLKQTGDLKKIDVDSRKNGDAAAFIKETHQLSDSEYHARMRHLRKVTQEVWHHIEDLVHERFIPPRSKYS